MSKSLLIKSFLGFIGVILVLNLFNHILVQVLVATPATFLSSEVDILDDETVQNMTELNLVSFERLVEFVEEQFDYDQIVSVYLRKDRFPVVYEVLLRVANQTHLIEIDGFRLSILRRKIRNLHPEYDDDRDDEEQNDRDDEHDDENDDEHDDEQEDEHDDEQDDEQEDEHE